MNSPNMKKSFLRNGVLITALIASVIILSAQINQKGVSSESQLAENPNEKIADTVAPVDNTEGLLELDKIIKRYETGNLYLSGEIHFYENKDSLSIPQEKAAFTSIITPEASSYEIDSVQTIVNENVTVLIDKKEKSIAIMEREIEAGQEVLKMDLAAQLREFKDYIYAITVNKNGTQKKLSIEFKDDAPSNTSLYEITYDPSTYQIKMVRMEIADGEITDSNENQNEEDELVYVDEKNNEIETGYYADVKVNVYELRYKVERKAESDLIDITNFVSKVNDSYVPVGSFKNYEILN